MLLTCEQKLETLDLRGCNLNLNDMQVLQEAIKQNARLKLKEINAGLNRFNRTDLRSLIAKQLASSPDGDTSPSEGLETGPSTRKNSFQQTSTPCDGLAKCDPLSVVDILSGPDDRTTDALSFELSQCLKLY